MAAYLIATGQSGANRILFDAAESLRTDGWVLAGAVLILDRALAALPGRHR